MHKTLVSLMVQSPLKRQIMAADLVSIFAGDGSLPMKKGQTGFRINPPFPKLLAPPELTSHQFLQSSVQHFWKLCVQLYALLVKQQPCGDLRQPFYGQLFLGLS